MGFKIPLDEQIKTAGISAVAPEREYRFWPGRQFKFDLAWPGIKLAVEIEGGFYGRGAKCPMCGRRPPGAHSSIERLLSDREKYNRANWDGWMLIRVLPEEVENGKALDMIEFSILTLQLRTDKVFPFLTDLERTKYIERRKQLKDKAGYAA